MTADSINKKADYIDIKRMPPSRRQAVGPTACFMGAD